MEPGYLISKGLEEFAAAREQFGCLMDQLQAEHMLRREHGDVEELISKQGTELLRLLLQGHLDLRAARESQRAAVRGADGVLRMHCRKGCERALMTLFGEVTVRRMRYGAPGHVSVFALDAELNLPGDKYSHGLRKRVAEEVAKNSFDEAVASLERTTGGKVPKRQSEEIAVEASRDFTAFYASREAQAPEDTLDPLVMSLDGKGVVMRVEDLREGTRKAARRARHKLKTRLSRGEKRNRKRMATVATVYTLAPQVRTPEAIMGREDEPCAERPRAQNKRVWASLERDPHEVTEEVFQEALRRDPEQRRVWAMLVDGHKEQLKHIRACMQRHLVGVILILDFVHVLEYLWKAAYCFHAPGTEQAESWVGERALQILRGNSSHVAAGMRRSATLRQLLPKQRQAVDECAHYLLTYKDMLKYDEYLAQGLPIATGVIEGACRHLVKDRMDLTGARWGLQRAEAVLKLRSLASSGDSEQYWEFYKAQALRRNHTSHFASPTLQEAA